MNDADQPPEQPDAQPSPQLQPKQAIIKTGGHVQAIAPQSFDEMWRVAGMFAAAEMGPADIRTQEKICTVIMAGAEIGLAPFQALQSFAIINGRVCLWGDGMLAVVRSKGVTVKEWFEGEGDGLVANCIVTRPDTKEEIHRTFSWADAVQAGLSKKQGPWQQYPKRMTQMRARGWACRDGCADILRGVQMVEEVRDYVVTSEPLPAISGAAFGQSEPDEFDQRPASEIAEDRNQRFLSGEAKDLVIAKYRAEMDGAADLVSLDKTFASFKRKYYNGSTRKVSDLTFLGVETDYEDAKLKHEDSTSIFAWATNAIQGAGTLSELEAWRASIHTEKRLAKLPASAQKAAETLYAERQEAFAEAIHADLARERKTPKANPKPQPTAK